MSVPRILILFLMLVVAVTHGVKPTFAGVVFLAKSGAPSCSGVNGYIADPQTRAMARYKFSAHAVYHTSCHPPQGTGERCHDYTRQSRDDIVVNVNGVCNACAIQAPSDEELDDKERLFVKGLIFLILLAVTCAIGKRIR